MKKRILFVVPSLAGGGAQRVVTILLEHIDRSRFEPCLAILKSDGDEGVFLKEIPHDVNIANLNCRRVRYSAIRLLRTIWKIRPHLILSTLGHMNLLLIMTKPFFPGGTGLWIREANTPSLSLNHSRYPRLFQALYRLLYPFADGIICQSKTIRDDLVQYANLRMPLNIKIAPNPVDIEKIRRLAANGGNPYSDKPALRIVAAGRLTAQKGFDMLITAFAEVKQALPDSSLAILGTGPDEAPLKGLAEALKVASSVRFAGFQENPYPWFAHADCFVLSSRWEGFPNVAVEALSCGTPVVAFDRAGAVGEIIRNGENGRLVKQNDTKALARSILECSKSGIFSARRDLSPRKFDSGKITREYESFFIDADRP